MHRRVILVVESPFSQRDAARFGVAELVETGLAVEAWDVCDLTLPYARLQWHEPARNLHVEHIGSRDRLGELAASLTDRDAVILICGTHTPLQAVHQSLFSHFLTSPAIVGTLALGCIPAPVGREGIVNGAFLQYARLRERIRPCVRVPRPLDFVWAATSPAGVSPALIGPGTSLRFIHALDHDLTTRLDRVTSRQDFALLLDTMGPLHPDFITLQLGSPWPVGCYETIVADVLSDLRRRGIDVVVAAHPRAGEGSLNEIYQGVPVVHGQTPQLLDSCAFAVCIEGSTALGMAATLGTPVQFVTGQCLPAFVRRQQRPFVRALCAPLVDVAALGSVPLPPSVDVSAYARYVRDYIKRPGTPEGRFWSVVAEDLRRHWGE